MYCRRRVGCSLGFGRHCHSVNRRLVLRRKGICSDMLRTRGVVRRRRLKRSVVSSVLRLGRVVVASIRFTVLYRVLMMAIAISVMSSMR